jgi:hypothetical protein
MKILAISGRKQSGKSTAANFFVSIVMSDLKIADHIYLDDSGRILVSDLLGNKEYSGVFDPCNRSMENKDTIINEVFKRLDPVIKIHNFADVLKQDICMNILGLNYNQCYGSDEEKNTLTELQIDGNNASSREIMQYIGTDIFRQIKDDVWVSATINKIIHNPSRIIIISDCRFPNEVQSIKNIGGKTLRLKRNAYNSNHISETILDEENYDWSNFDYVIDNTNIELQEYLKSLKPILGKLFV